MGLREQKKEQTRRDLELAAFEMFEEWGYGASRTVDIAERAGVSESTLFRYFSTKEEMALAPFRRRCELLKQRVLDRPMTESPLEVCIALAEEDDMLELVPGVGRRSEWMVLTEAPEIFPQVLHIIYDTELNVAANFLERLGPGREMEAMTIASAVGGVLQAMLLMWALDPEDFDPVEATRAGIRRLKDGLD